MNIDPPKEWDPTEALQLFGEPTSERYGLPDRTFFYLLITCRAIEAFAESSFTIDHVHIQKPTGQVGSVITPAGACVDFVVKSHAFRIDTWQRVKLWASIADEPDSDGGRYLVYDGDASDAKAWESLLMEIGRVERFGVVVTHADTLRRMWSEWLIEQDRGRGERGF